MLDIHGIMRGLAEKRPGFHSEADFQFALAWHIKESMLETEIRLEYEPFPESPRRKRLDVWIQSLGIAIELKYRKKALDYTDQNGERYLLTDQSAHDQGRFDFADDIQRLERVVRQRCDTSRGIAVILTNDGAYWKKPTRRGWQDTRDAEFRIHEGVVLKGDMNWKKGTSDGTKGGRTYPISLRDSYPVNWRHYSKLDVPKNGAFRYLAVEVGK